MDDDFRRLREAAIRETIREHRRETLVLWAGIVISILLVVLVITTVRWEHLIDGN